MNTVSKVVGGMVVLAIVAVPVTAYVTGLRVEADYKDAVHSLRNQSDLLQVIDSRYDRGLLRSTAMIRLHIGCETALTDDGVPMGREITIHETIHHGPFLPGAHFGAALIDSSISISPEVDQALKKAFGDHDPLKIQTRVSFRKTYTTDFEIPALKTTLPGDVSIDWSGLKGEMETDSAHNFRSNISMPKLRIEGTTQGLLFTLNDIQYHHQGLRTEAEHGLMGSLMSPGHVDWHLGQLQFKYGDDKSFSFENLSLTSDSSVNNGLLQGAEHFTGRGNIAGQQIDSLEVDGSSKHVHYASLITLMNKMNSAQSFCPRPDGTLPHGPDFNDPEIQTALITLMHDNPQFSVNKAELSLNGKRGGFSYHWGFNNISDDDLRQNLVQIFVRHFHATGDIHIPQAWIDLFVQKTSSTPELSMATAQRYQLVIDTGVQMGWFVKDANSVRTNFDFQQHDVRLNNIPFTPEAFAVAMQANSPAVQR